MLGISNLHEIRHNHSNMSPAEILEELDRRIKSALQKSEKQKAEDGMDLSLYILNKRTKELQYA
ncbi:MAG: hypothetical protein GXP45_03040 [bacterium]|nr:hypothetical protein [bacterium]